MRGFYSPLPLLFFSLINTFSKLKLQPIMKRRILIILLFIGAISSFFACKNNDYNYVDVSLETRQAFGVMYPGATNIGWEVESGLYVVKYTLEGHFCESWYHSNAEWMQTFKTIPAEALPENVKIGYSNSKYSNLQIEAARVVTKPNEPNTYMIDCTSEQEICILFSANGDLLITYK